MPTRIQENALPGLWYKVTVGRPDPIQTTPIIDLTLLAKALPHGSGIDGNWYIHVHNNGSLTISGEYHVMDDNGYYRHWESFSFRLYAAKADCIVKLKGPCEGQTQVVYYKGEALMSGIYGLTSYSRGRLLHENLWETIEYALSQAGIKVQGEYVAR